MLFKDDKARALIFDLDGTLANSMPLHFKAWSHVCKKYQLHFPHDMFLNTAGNSTMNIATTLINNAGYDIDAKDIANEKADFFLNHINSIEPIFPVLNLLKYFSGKLPIAIGTGGRRKVVSKTIEALKISDKVDYVVTANDVKNHKPHPDTFLRCAELMNIPPEYCQVFEDGDYGITAAKKAGMIVTDIRLHLEM